MDYRKCAQEIFETVGKRDNLVSAAHCATRLRLVTKDNSKVDMKHLEDIDGVKGVFASNGQLQIILGTGVVNKVYDEFLSVSGMTAATKDEVKAAAAAKQPLPQRMVKALGDVFVPILPAIVAAGLMVGLVEALGSVIGAYGVTGFPRFLVTTTIHCNTLACNRQANDLGKFFDPHHPAVLRALKMATGTAHKAGDRNLRRAGRRPFTAGDLPCHQQR